MYCRNMCSDGTNLDEAGRVTLSFSMLTVLLAAITSNNYGAINRNLATQ